MSAADTARIADALEFVAGEIWALEILARAYDAEEASQMGERSPWALDDEQPPAVDVDTWRAERLGCALAAVEALADAFAAKAVQEADAEAKQAQERKASRK